MEILLDWLYDTRFAKDVVTRSRSTHPMPSKQKPLFSGNAISFIKPTLEDMHEAKNQDA